jgi:hypothetical protein
MTFRNAEKCRIKMSRGVKSAAAHEGDLAVRGALGSMPSASACQRAHLLFSINPFRAARGAIKKSTFWSESDKSSLWGRMARRKRGAFTGHPPGHGEWGCEILGVVERARESNGFFFETLIL